MKASRTIQEKVSLSFLFSVFLHAGFLAVMVKVVNSRPEVKTVTINNELKNSIKLDDIKFITKSQLQDIKTRQGKQIVASENNGREVAPDNSRFMGEKNQVHDRQTIAARNGSFKEAGLGKKNGAEHAAVSEVTKPAKSPVKNQVTSTKPRSKALSMSDLGGVQLAEIEKTTRAEDKALEDMAREIERESKVGALGSERGAVGKVGLAQNNDFVEDVPLGDMTNLNTTEFKYYGFYHRIRQKLEQHWGSSIRDKAKNLYRSGRRVPASDNLITSVSVTLNDKGQIVDMQIEGTSGVKELDQAAIESFNKAGPFPNPPKGLLVGGRATIQWGFVVKS
jgi:TonB family protein